MPQSIVVMGVSGAGKSSVGQALATQLGAEFVDGDTLHPEANVRKMASGAPLTDEDRWPWLHRVGAQLSASTGNGTTVACSALKRSYRDAIRAAAPATMFILLQADRPALQDRLTQRPGHFMPASLLTSQLETLEELQDDESGLMIESTGGIDTTVERIRKLLERSVLV
ncbi:gluconokinase [Pseudarthrobacter sp. BRE9]|uniref:gluconokinase n=1 Tax=Pseudarthrobacter sp. BRE9 TaxID=2962582 RepID=UPI002880E056|nr:gluconokinase [Pseudarthrobacter sp. BRE9]MDT0169575.1 gluconokinase [Pseudarthrobacter sp. BRE9]